ncbi:MAG: DUF3997 domain-containing protein [Cyclobacteriaceae bacterium]
MDKIKSLLIITLTVLINSCSSDTTEKLGNGYFFRNEGSLIKDILCESPKGGEIPATVVEYVYDNKFIVAKQMPKIPQDPLYEKTYNYTNGNNQYYYWLILKESNTVFGPLSINELDSIRTEYNIPKTLKLK